MSSSVVCMSCLLSVCECVCELVNEGKCCTENVLIRKTTMLVAHDEPCSRLLLRSTADVVQICYVHTVMSGSVGTF